MACRKSTVKDCSRSLLFNVTHSFIMFWYWHYVWFLLNILLFDTTIFVQLYFQLSIFHTQLHSSHFILKKIFAKISLSQRVDTKSNHFTKWCRLFPFSPRIKLKRSYHTNYHSSFYQLHQHEFFICTSILVFKHILYTTMPYISNAKIDYNFISPSFQYTQLQHFCPQIPQQRAGYSTSCIEMEVWLCLYT